MCDGWANQKDALDRRGLVLPRQQWAVADAVLFFCFWIGKGEEVARELMSRTAACRKSDTATKTA